jgi:hypothetical protein
MLSTSAMNTRQFISIVKSVAYSSTSVKGEGEHVLLLVDGPASIRSSRFTDKGVMNRRALCEVKRAQWIFWIVPEQWYILSTRKNEATGEDELYWARFDPGDYIEGNHVSRSAEGVKVPEKPLFQGIAPRSAPARKQSVAKFF